MNLIKIFTASAETGVRLITHSDGVKLEQKVQRERIGGAAHCMSRAADRPAEDRWKLSVHLTSARIGDTCLRKFDALNVLEIDMCLPLVILSSFPETFSLRLYLTSNTQFH